MDGSMELSFLVPHHEKSRLLASIDEITQAGLPTLEITAKKKRKKSLIVLLPGIAWNHLYITDLIVIQILLLAPGHIIFAISVVIL